MSTEQPIACDFTAIDSSERETHKQKAEEVFTSVSTWRELSDGYAFRLPTETPIIEKAGAFIARERLCCPFFNFDLQVAADRGPVWLTITGTEEAKDYIAQNVIPQIENAPGKETWDLPENAITACDCD
jgi:hypothetical protein